jgi:hypothetical protein
MFLHLSGQRVNPEEHTILKDALNLKPHTLEPQAGTSSHSQVTGPHIRQLITTHQRAVECCAQFHINRPEACSNTMMEQFGGIHKCRWPTLL